MAPSPFGGEGDQRRRMATPGSRRAGYVIGLTALAIAIGGAAVFTVEQAARQSETIEFCISCHIMEATVFEEYKSTSHYSNASGVRATCADCHVPDRHSAGEVASYLSVKLGAARFLYGWATGRMSDPEQLEASREQLAERVWTRMRADDSLACRRCHDEGAMNLSLQTARARELHTSGKEEGKTCIDCHDDGLAHRAVEREVPEGEQETDFMLD